MVHIETPSHTLRVVLSDARPNWSEKDLAAVEEKLSRVGADTTEKLAQLLADGLNKRLLAAGQKAFNSETLAALRGRLAKIGSHNGLLEQESHGDCQTKDEGRSDSASPDLIQGNGGVDGKFLPKERVFSTEKPASSGGKATFSPSAPFGRLEALGETQLIKAVRQTDVRTVQYLIEHRANPNEKDNFGETALMEAAAQGHHQLCKVLLENGANIAHKSPTGLSAKDFATEQVLRKLGLEICRKSVFFSKFFPLFEASLLARFLGVSRTEAPL